MADIITARLDKEQTTTESGRGQVTVVLSPSFIEKPRVLLTCNWIDDEGRHLAYQRVQAFIDGFQVAQSIAREP